MSVRMHNIPDTQLRALDAFLKQQLLVLEPSLRVPATYCLEARGKRLRPTLVFLAGEQATDPEALIRAAAIVELVHVATLVHDDILDDAKIRHGRATVAQQWSPHVAILLGDALFAHALELAASFPSPWVCGSVAKAVRRVCAGEIKQTLEAQAQTLEQYREIISLKTGELFELAVSLGAYAAGASPAHITALAPFGRHLGIAYQMLDDILDVWGDEATLGKTLGSDAKTGKHTLPHLVLPPPLGAAHRQASYELFHQELQKAQAALPAHSSLLAVLESFKGQEELAPLGSPTGSDF